MNKIIFTLMSLMVFTVNAETMIVLKFDDIQAHNKWIEWYLDQGGEEQSGFIVKNWDWQTMHLQFDCYEEGESNEKTTLVPLRK